MRCQNRSFKVNDDVKQAATQAIADATTDDEKLKRLYDYARLTDKEYFIHAHVSDEDRKKVRKPKRPAIH